MAGKFLVNNTPGGSYLFGEDALNNLVNYIRDAHGDGVSVSATFGQNRTIESDDASDIFSDALSRSTEMTSFKITAFSEAGSTYLEILNKNHLPIICNITGDRGWVLPLEERISHEISASSRWWGIFRDNTPIKSTLSFIYFVMSLIAFGLLVIAVTLEMPNAVRWILAVCVLLLLSVIIKSAMNWLFPVVQFSIGVGERKASARMTTFNIVSVAVLLAIVVGLVTGWIGKQLGIA
ncbi:hypothetical protein ATCR1_04619 [Agrobacterium tumefaciens CCNWGS0286]|uniref:hypothetical protein n=1 Tax=Agrobacterium tumefaciens TaxID=358 RepID=UPI0002331776|nr:hypothetical protein [Agrobacterium tumefaciens]EHH08192.1 hypothetical protein ATCR1_04619 [Agrobacterium tumefaciens CCNWGS0286]